MDTQGDELMQQYLVAMSVFVVGISFFSLVYFRMSVIISKRLHNNMFQVVMGAKTHFFDSNPVGKETCIEFILVCFEVEWMVFMTLYFLVRVLSAADLRDSICISVSQLNSHAWLCHALFSFRSNIEQICKRFGVDRFSYTYINKHCYRGMFDLFPSSIFTKQINIFIIRKNPWLEFNFSSCGSFYMDKIVKIHINVFFIS